MTVYQPDDVGLDVKRLTVIPLSVSQAARYCLLCKPIEQRSRDGISKPILETGVVKFSVLPFVISSASNVFSALHASVGRT